MLHSGQARLAMYDLIFNRPICDYPTDGHLRVAILGEGPVCCEAFKACFSLGQAALPLHITVAGKDAVAFGSKILDPAGDYPDLKRFAEEEGYAELSFMDMDFSVTSAEKCARELQSESFGYIILATENKRVSKAFAAAIAKRAHSKCLIAVDAPELTCEITEPNAEVYPYGLEANYVELTRLAKNINFAYATSGQDNQRASRKIVDAKFEVSKNAEFLSDDTTFTGAKYDADSSFACAAHIPVKLSLCIQLSCSDRSAESVLSESIIKKTVTYNRLLELEHRRWVAYMTIRGFRAPTDEEEQTLLYQYVDGRFNEHRDKENRIHICMCTSEANGVTLGQDDLQWAKDPDRFPSKLDQASVRAHRLATDASKVVIRNKEQLLGKLDPHDHYHNDFKAAVEKLLNNDCNAEILYESAKATILANRPDTQSVVEEIETQLKVVKCRNRRTDFVSIDAQLIDFLPFCLWYRKKYQTVITLTSKNPVRDVVIPTLFCAENALFLGPEIENDVTYQSRIRTYFEKRGNNTNAVPEEDIFKYKDCDTNSIPDILASLEQFKQALLRGDAILNFVGGQDNKIALAVGMFLQANNAIAMYYDPKQCVVPVSGDPYIAAGLDNKSFSVSEIIELIGGIVKNPQDLLSCENDREKLADIFKEFCRRKTYYEGQTAFHFNTWSLMNSVFREKAKAKQKKLYTDEKFDIDNCNKTVKHYSQTIDAKVFHLSGMQSWLEELQRFKVIANFTYVPTAQGVEIDFDYCEKEIVQAVEETRTRTRLKFNKEQGIKSFHIRLDDMVLTTDKEHVIIRKDKAAYMDALEQAGFIQNMSHRPEETKKFGKKCNYCCNDCKQRDRCDNHHVCKAATEKKETNYCYSFEFRDERIHWLLQQQGVPFEEIIYHHARKFGQFDDVQTGVQIGWIKDARNYNDLLSKKLESVQQRYGLCGYYIFKQATIEAKAALKWEENTGADNEIDVIAVQGMTPIFMSAKTNKSTENGWIYEIKSVADHFGAIPAMIIAHDCDNLANSAFAARATQMNVSLLGLETMWNPERLQDAFASISRGILVKPRILKQKELTKDEL